MTYEVRYFSRTGNTKKLADAIAGALNVQAKTCAEPLDGPVDVLFLGGALYAGKIDPSLHSFLEGLSPDMVKEVAVFTTSLGSEQTPQAEIAAILKARGIPMAEASFHCRGRFLFFNRKRPNEQDLLEVAAFAEGFR